MYAKVKASQVPARERKSESRFERTEEWHMMKADLERGIKPQEALQVTFTEADMKKIGITNRRTIARFVQKYVTAKGFPYVVKSLHRENREFVIVQPEEAKSTRGRRD